MKRLLGVLFLSLVFFLPSFAGDEKDKNIPWYLSSPCHYSYSTYPPSLFDPNYLDKHNRWQEYFNSFTYRPRTRAIVVLRPPSFGEAFLWGLSKGISKGMDNYYRRKEQERDIRTTMALLKLKWASEGRYSKPSQPHEYRNEYRMSPKEKQANLDRIKELDRIIEQKYKKREKLIKYLKSMGLPEMPDGLVPKGIYWNGKEWVGKKQEK